METIEEKAKEYARSTFIGSKDIKETAYIQGAKDMLHALMLTMSISEDGYLEENLTKMIKGLRGNLTFEDVGILDDDLGL